jgi:hypothetical protein
MCMTTWREKIGSMDLRQDQTFFDLLVGSYHRLTGDALIPSGGMTGKRALEWLYKDAPFAVLAHNSAQDPVFIYANKTAQRIFEYEWDEFMALPSRLSAEAPERSERLRFLEQVKRDGFIRGYSGVRISKSARRFRITNATVWQLTDTDDIYLGQAAVLPQISVI